MLFPKTKTGQVIALQSFCSRGALAGEVSPPDHKRLQFIKVCTPDASWGFCRTLRQPPHFFRLSYRLAIYFSDFCFHFFKWVLLICTVHPWKPVPLRWLFTIKLSPKWTHWPTDQLVALLASYVNEQQAHWNPNWGIYSTLLTVFLPNSRWYKWDQNQKSK